MVHVLAPRPPNEKLPVFFNVDGVVGAAPARNLREDVMLVQFMFKFEADGGQVQPPELLVAFKKVQVTGTCDGATIAAIRLSQERFKKRNPTTVADGRVSPANGYSYGGALYTIVHYNNIIQARCRDVWPRIDKLPGCPPDLRAAIFRAVVDDFRP